MLPKHLHSQRVLQNSEAPKFFDGAVPNSNEWAAVSGITCLAAWSLAGHGESWGILRLISYDCVLGGFSFVGASLTS